MARGRRRHTVAGGGGLRSADGIAIVYDDEGHLDIDATMRLVRRRARRQTYYLPLPGRRRYYAFTRKWLLSLDMEAKADPQ